MRALLFRHRWVLLALPCVAAVVLVPLAWAQGMTGATTSEVLVLTTATRLPVVAGRVGIEIFNAGPNTIFCAFTSATAVVDKARPIAVDTSWALDAKGEVDIWCVAATANQVTGNATVVSQLKQ